MPPSVLNGHLLPPKHLLQRFLSSIWVLREDEVEVTSVNNPGTIPRIIDRGLVMGDFFEYLMIRERSAELSNDVI